jgi:hypothetical protein
MGRDKYKGKERTDEDDFKWFHNDTLTRVSNVIRRKVHKNATLNIFVIKQRRGFSA